jgi:DNA-binding protein HU-beta
MKLWMGLNPTCGRSHEACRRNGDRTTSRQLAAKVAATRLSGGGPSASSPEKMGGAEGTRTPDPHTASVVRYQLRHSPGIHRIRPLRAEGSSYTGPRECQITRPEGYSKGDKLPRHAEHRPQNTGHPRPGPILWLIGTPTTKGDFVNRKELVTAVADEASLEQKTVDAVLRALQSTLEGAVSKGDKVSVPGFFAVSVGRRAAREGRNPATGATITIAAANTVKFTAGSALKEAANR